VVLDESVETERELLSVVHADDTGSLDPEAVRRVSLIDHQGDIRIRIEHPDAIKYDPVPRRLDEPEEVFQARAYPQEPVVTISVGRASRIGVVRPWVALLGVLAEVPQYLLLCGMVAAVGVLLYRINAQHLMVLSVLAFAGAAVLFLRTMVGRVRDKVHLGRVLFAVSSPRRKVLIYLPASQFGELGAFARVCRRERQKTKAR